MNISILKKPLTKKLANDLPCTSIMRNKLEIKVHFLINAINIAMSLAISKTRFSPKSVLKFDKKCKEL